jgi:hypothetical protein
LRRREIENWQHQEEGKPLKRREKIEIDTKDDKWGLLVTVAKYVKWDIHLILSPSYIQIKNRMDPSP